MNMPSVVQMSCRQRAVIAALALPVRQRGTPCVRLARYRSRDPRGPVKAEGQIKEVARRAPPSQSARGFAAAPQELLRVPRKGWKPRHSGVRRVPYAPRCATVRRSLHDSP